MRRMEGTMRCFLNLTEVGIPILGVCSFMFMQG